MTTSVIIPCTSKHFHYIHNLLECYERQTVLPNEIVISLSDVEQLHPTEIPSLQAGAWPFELKIV